MCVKFKICIMMFDLIVFSFSVGQIDTHMHIPLTQIQPYISINKICTDRVIIIYPKERRKKLCLIFFYYKNERRMSYKLDTAVCFFENSPL